MATPTDDLYRHNGSRYLRLSSDNAEAFIGNELEVQATYAWNAYLSVGGGLGRLFRGPVLNQHSPGGSPALGFVFMELKL